MKLTHASVVVLLLVGCPVAPSGNDGGEVDAGFQDAGVVDAGGDAGPEIITPNTQGWWRDKVMYEVFVRSFYDSNADGIGDFAGLIAKLDYLNDGNPATHDDLGVDALWLMPIYPCSSYHGYDVTNYEAVNSDFGTLAEFDTLVAQAHQRGMKIILDFVPNHTSTGHPWFRNASASSTSTYRDYYVWSDTDPGWRRVPDLAQLWHPSNGSYFYGYFGTGMPDLNYRNPDVQQAVIDAMKFWLGHGVDGFRVDAARYLFEATDGGARGVYDQLETHEFIQRARLELHRTWPQALLIAEAWATQDTVVSYYGQGNEYQLAFAFDLAEAMVSSVVSQQASGVINVIARNEPQYVGKDRGFEAPFLTNHDMIRVSQKLAGNVAAAKVAAATLLAMPGTPFLYYGEEIGMAGESGSADEGKRTPMRWVDQAPQYGFTTRGSSWYGATHEAAGVDVATQSTDASSLLSMYRKLIALRHAQTPLASGRAERVMPPGAPASFFGLLRIVDSKRVLFVANYSMNSIGSMSISLAGQPTLLLGEGPVSVSASGSTLTVDGLGAYGFAFISLD